MQARHETVPKPPDPKPDASRLLHWSWAWLAITGLVWIVAFAAAEGLYALLGFEGGMGGEPLWADLVVGAVLWVPVATTLTLSLVAGVRALRAGSRSVWVPIVIAAASVLGMLILIVAQLVDAVV